MKKELDSAVAVAAAGVGDASDGVRGVGAASDGCDVVVGAGAIRTAGQPSGGKISSRHLRRRTGSHKRRRRHRFPRGEDSGKVNGGDGADVKIAASTTSNDGKADQNKEKNNVQTPKSCRRARRKPALLKLEHSTWWQSQSCQTASSTIQKTNENNNWIPTHQWHSKRFHMSSSPLFSWSVPLVHSNRGSRAALRLASSSEVPKCTVQDATWEIDGSALCLEVCGGDNLEQSVLDTLVSLLQRVCGDDENSFLRDETVLNGCKAGEGLIYDVDAFPLKPVGPSTFLFSKSNEGTKEVKVSIMVHPAIRVKVMSLIEDISSNINLEGWGVKVSTTSLSLLRIRGLASSATIASVLSLDSSKLNSSLEHGQLVEFDASNDTTTSAKSLITRHQPNQQRGDLPQNFATSGWDILFHPSIASSIFQSFATHGAACAIGLAEASRAQLEACPPLPIFPRDYPDTEAGKSYWEGNGDNGSDWVVIRECVEGSWGRMHTSLNRVLRNHKRFKGRTDRSEPACLGNAQSQTAALITRAQVLGRTTSTINWRSLIPMLSSLTSEESVVVVRGSFGIPFVQLLHGCGKLHYREMTFESHDVTQQRRLRRPACSFKSMVHASPLSREELGAHSELCQQMLESLSLPALLRCEIYCEGKGTLHPGDLLFPIAQDDVDDSNNYEEDNNEKEAEEKTIQPLGVVIAGGFSPSRGKCHGTGFLGAARFIEALDGTAHGMGKKVSTSEEKRMMLRIKVVGTSCIECVERYALVALLL